MAFQRHGRLHRGLTYALTGVVSIGLTLSGVEARTTALAADPPPKRVLSDPNPNFSGVWVDTTNNELVVGDDNKHAVLVYARTASGAATPLRSIQGLATGIDYPSTVVVDVTNNRIWAVDDDTSDRAVAFTRTANGNVAPSITVDFKALALTEKRTWGWAADAVNGEVAGTFQNGNSIHFFDDIGSTDVRAIVGPATGLADPHGLFIDNVNNEVIAVNEGHTGGGLAAPSITVHSRTASGNVAPLRTISGALTGLDQPKGLHVDLTNNEIAVANSGTNSIAVYSRTASGNVAPVRTISGLSTGLSKPASVFIDSVNNEIVVTNWGGHTVTAYPRTANGNVAPLRTITSGTATVVGFGNPGAMSTDTVNGEFYVTNCVSHPRIAAFGRLASGQTAPVRVIEGQATHISRSLHGVVVDPVNNEIFVPSTLENAILVFNRLDSGNVAPKRIINGALTGIAKPQGIAVDTTNNEIALANEGDANAVPVIPPSITIYGRLATGNVAPLRTITGASTGLSKPVGIWVDAVNNEIVLGDGTDAAEAVFVYARTGSGNIAPIRTISGASTMLSKTRQVIVDTTNNEIYVANQGDRSVNPPVFGNVAVFDRLANGNVAPKRFLQQVTQSFVEHPRSIWLDLGNSELGVGDSKLNEVRVFDRLFGAGAPPPAPTGLAATAGNAQVSLSWTASAGATSYNIKRATVTGGPYTAVATGVTVTSFTDTTVVNGTTYFYVVSAVNANGESANSNEASATPSANTPPPAPTGLTATAGKVGSLTITLNWTASAGATSYNVLRSTVTGGPYTVIATGVTVTTFKNTGLTKGVTYFYVVQAVNAAGTSPNSNEASATAR